MRWTTLLIPAFAAFAMHTAGAAELQLLSAGAIEPGLRPALAAFEASTGHRVQLRFAAAPQLRELGKGGAVFDLVIAPPAILDELETVAKIDADRTRRVPLGRVGVGVAVRPGAPLPDISTAAAFTTLLREADSLVYNRASTGVYVETMLRTLGIEPGARATRYPDGAAVMLHVLNDKSAKREIGLGATTEILLLRDRGLQFVGPLPAALQNYTSYVAITAATPAQPDAARALLAYLASPAVRTLFVSAGIDRPD